MDDGNNFKVTSDGDECNSDMNLFEQNQNFDTGDHADPYKLTRQVIDFIQGRYGKGDYHNILSGTETDDDSSNEDDENRDEEDDFAEEEEEASEKDNCTEEEEVSEDNCTEEEEVSEDNCTEEVEVEDYYTEEENKGGDCEEEDVEDHCEEKDKWEDTTDSDQELLLDGNFSWSEDQPSDFALLIGNLTWWTTDEDISRAVLSLGVTDISGIRFYDSSQNGASQGFCLLRVLSEDSFLKVMHKLSDKLLHGRYPIVRPFTEENVLYFQSLGQSSRGRCVQIPSAVDNEGEMENNIKIATNAIASAVSDAIRGDFSKASHALLTAVCIINHSAVSHDNQCRILVSLLQTVLHAIEYSGRTIPRDNKKVGHMLQRFLLLTVIIGCVGFIFMSQSEIQMPVDRM